MELKPCPFCGEKAEYVEALQVWIHCTNQKCHGRMSCGERVLNSQQFKEANTKEWNTRPIEESLQEQIAHLQQENKRLNGRYEHWFKEATKARGQLTEKDAEIQRLKDQLQEQIAKNYELCDLYLRCGYPYSCKHYKEAENDS